MKKVFFVLLAAVALSFSACTSGEKKTEMMDSTSVSGTVNEVMDSVKSDMSNMADTANHMMDAAVDSAKKM